MDERDEEKKQQRLDSRSQERYLRKRELTAQELQAHIESLPDLSGQETGFSEPQPALGTFTPEELARIQKNFPYPR